MTVRQKISLLITAAGFLVSLVFSCIIVWEMQDQPFRIMDSYLKTTAERVVQIIVENDKGDLPLFMSDKGYWLKVLGLLVSKGYFILSLHFHRNSGYMYHACSSYIWFRPQNKSSHIWLNQSLAELAKDRNCPA